MFNHCKTDRADQRGNSMPTKRTRVMHTALPQISPTILSILSEGLSPLPDGEAAEREAANWEFSRTDEEKARIFFQVKDAILAEWMRQRPGTRPDFWWRTEAPEKCRRRLGGIGDAAHEHLADVESYNYGIPSVFVSRFQESYYNGRARDVNGKPIGTEHAEGDFAGRAIDPNDPPAYESEAAYLKRHDLLSAEEKRRLRKKDFEPEIICFDDDPADQRKAIG